MAHGYIANRVSVVGVVSYGDKHALARLQCEIVAPLRLVWTPQGHRPSPPAPKQWGRQQPRAISTPPLSVWTSSHPPDRRECSGAPVLGLIDCLFEKVVSWQDTGTPCTQSLHGSLAYCRDSQPIYCGRKHQPSCQRKTGCPVAAIPKHWV